VRVLGRPAACLGLREQRLVTLLRGLERVGAHYALARVILLAIAPSRRARRVAADRRDAGVRAALGLDRPRAVAAEIALVGPERAVLVEILRREEIDRERLHALRRGAVPCGAVVDLDGLAIASNPLRPERADDE